MTLLKPLVINVCRWNHFSKGGVKRVEETVSERNTREGIPLFAAWAAAPEAFLYGVVTYGATAPHAWYALNGAGVELAPLGKAAQLLLALIKGPALIALLLVGFTSFMARGQPETAGRRMALWMVAGAFVGAALPTPAQLQYVMPLVPPLTLALGYVLDDARRWSGNRRHILLGLLSIGVVPACCCRCVTWRR